MSDLTEGLEVLIQKAALDGALTQDAVAQFHSLVKERNALKTDNEHYHLKNEELDKRVTDLSAKYNAHQEKLAAWAQRETDLKDREGKCTELEVRKECSDLRVADHQEMFKIVFRNAIIRKEIMTVVPGTDGGQFQTPLAGYTSKDSVEEEET